MMHSLSGSAMRSAVGPLILPATWLLGGAIALWELVGALQMHPGELRASGFPEEGIWMAGALCAVVFIEAIMWFIHRGNKSLAAQALAAAVYFIALTSFSLLCILSQLGNVPFSIFLAALLLFIASAWSILD